MLFCFSVTCLITLSSNQICGHRIVHDILLLPFNTHGVDSDGLTFISDVGGMRLLSFFFSYHG